MFRWFVLQGNGKLTYYSMLPGVPGAKILGWMDVSIACAVLPGGRCVECQWPRASTSYCFGIISPQRKLFLIADSVPDLNTWLRCFRDMLSPEIPVTNVREVEVSFKPGAPLPPLPEPTVTRRITLLRNGGDTQGRVVAAPSDMPSCLALASSVLGIQATRLFTDKGGEITDFSLVRDNDVIYVSKGEAFADTAAERLLRTAMAIAESSGKQADALHLQSLQILAARPHSERDRDGDSDGEAAPFAFSNPVDEDEEKGYASAAQLRARALAKQGQGDDEVFDEPVPVAARAASAEGDEAGGVYMEVQRGTAAAGDAEAEDGPTEYQEPVVPLGPPAAPPAAAGAEAGESEDDEEDEEEEPGYVAPDHASDNDDDTPGYVAPGSLVPEEPDVPGYVALDTAARPAPAPAPAPVLEPAPLLPPKKVTSRVQF